VIQRTSLAGLATSRALLVAGEVVEITRQISGQVTNGLRPQLHRSPWSTLILRFRFRCFHAHVYSANASRLCRALSRRSCLRAATVDHPPIRPFLRFCIRYSCCHSGGCRRQRGRLVQRVLTFERTQVLAELERHGRQITQTARALGLERSHLYKKCQQLGIDLRNLSRE